MKELHSVTVIYGQKKVEQMRFWIQSLPYQKVSGSGPKWTGSTTLYTRQMCRVFQVDLLSILDRSIKYFR
jgi:hypothetical protein